MDLHPTEKETLRRLDNLTSKLNRTLAIPQAVYLEDLEELENGGEEEKDEWD